MEQRNPGPTHPPGVTRELVRELHELGWSRRDIAAKLGVTKGTVTYHVRRLDLPINDRFGRRYDWAEIRKAYESGLSARACRQKFGFSRDAWHEAVRRGDIVPRPRLIPIEELLVIGRCTSRNHLKLRILAAGLKENRCEECGISEWRGKPLSIELHHVNGVKLDNRLENLRFLCGNCHSQTHTWGGRNMQRKKAA
jgi:hypothetical protein